MKTASLKQKASWYLILSGAKTCLTLGVGILMIVMTVNMELLRHCLEKTAGIFKVSELNSLDWTEGPTTSTLPFSTRIFAFKSEISPKDKYKSRLASTASPQRTSRQPIFYHCILSALSHRAEIRLCPSQSGRFTTGKRGWYGTFHLLDKSSTNDQPMTFASLDNSSQILLFHSWLGSCNRTFHPMQYLQQCKSYISPISDGFTHSPQCPYFAEIKDFDGFKLCLNLERTIDHLIMNSISLTSEETHRIDAILTHYLPYIKKPVPE